MVGLGLFAYVLTRTPLADIAGAVGDVGPLVAVSPIIAAAWFATRTSALSAVIGGIAPWRVLYRLRWIGDGYNGVIPLAGLGGEPFKLRILGRYTSVEQALAALVRDRLIAWFAVTRVLQGCETALLLALISAPTDAATILFVDGTLNAAGFLGFMLPQGLGTVEGTAAVVLTGLGLPLPAATAFALVRRGRVLASGAIAVVVHACTAAYQRRTSSAI